MDDRRYFKIRMISISKYGLNNLVKNILIGIILFGFATAGSFNLPLHYIGSILLIFFWIFSSRVLKFNNLIILYSCFTIYAVTSGVLISMNKETFFTHAFLLIQLCFISILVFNIFNREKNLIIFSVILILLGIVLTIGPFIGIGEDISSRFFGLRYMGLTENPNILGMYINYLLMAILYLFSKLKKQNIIIKLLLSSLIILSIAGLLFAGSRKSIISFVLILLTYSFYEFKLKFRNIIYTTIVILILWYIFDILVGFTQDSALINRFASGELEEATEGRSVLIKEAFNVFLKYPFTGVGLANWSYSSNLGYFKYSHNYYVEVLANTGVFGFILIVAIYRQFTIYVLNLLKNYLTRSEGIYGMMYLAFCFVWSFGFSWYDAPHHLIFISVYSGFYYSISKNSNPLTNKFIK